LTAQRLIVERQDKAAVERVRELLPKSQATPGYVNMLWALHGLGALTANDVSEAFRVSGAGILEHALRLGEPYFAQNAKLRERAAALATHSLPRVRFQVALSAGALPPSEAARVLATVLERSPNDSWISTAALSSASACGFELLAASKTPNPAVVSRVAAMVGAKGDPKEIARALELVAKGADPAILDGLGQGMRASARPLPTWWAKPPAEAAEVMPKLRVRFERAAKALGDESATAPARVSAAELLAYGPFELAGGSLAEALAPAVPGDVQAAALRALTAHTDASVSDLLLKRWSGFGPALRRDAQDAMLARPDRALKLLDAVASKAVPVTEFATATVQQLKAHPNASVRAKAAAVFTQSADADRAKVVKAYAAALDLKGDAEKGRAVFKKSCAACHKLDGVGSDVGANLLAALPNKSGEDLLSALFDPNREVDPRYVSYQVVTTDERVLLGVVATETPTSITLRRADGKEDVILRANVSSIRSTALSLMPVGLEKELTPQTTADLFAYLRVAGK
jgi:putative heme-binding domain-containing protein